MGSWTAEFNAFGIANPLSHLTPDKTERFTDRYIHIAPSVTVKIRNERTFKIKDLKGEERGIQLFETGQIEYESRDASRVAELEDFLKLRNLEGILENPGVRVEKERDLYIVGGATIHYLTFSFNGCQDTALSIVSGGRPRIVAEHRSKLNLDLETNLNFADYLAKYV